MYLWTWGVDGANPGSRLGLSVTQTGIGINNTPNPAFGVDCNGSASIAGVIKGLGWVGCCCACSTSPTPRSLRPALCRSVQGPTGRRAAHHQHQLRSELGGRGDRRRLHAELLGADLGFLKPPSSDTYVFSVYADDGVRVWVNGTRCWTPGRSKVRRSPPAQLPWGPPGCRSASSTARRGTGPGCKCSGGGGQQPVVRDVGALGNGQRVPDGVRQHRAAALVDGHHVVQREGVLPRELRVWGAGLPGLPGGRSWGRPIVGGLHLQHGRRRQSGDQRGMLLVRGSARLGVRAAAAGPPGRRTSTPSAAWASRSETAPSSERPTATGRCGSGTRPLRGRRWTWQGTCGAHPAWQR